MIGFRLRRYTVRHYRICDACRVGFDTKEIKNMPSGRESRKACQAIGMSRRISCSARDGAPVGSRIKEQRRRPEEGRGTTAETERAERVDEQDARELQELIRDGFSNAKIPRRVMARWLGWASKGGRREIEIEKAQKGSREETEERENALE